MIAIWCALSASSNGYTYTDSSGLTWDWRISGNGAILEYTDYGEYDEDPIPCISGAIPSTLTIPSTVKLNNTTYPIIGIGSSAFYHCSNITAVIIPNSVQSIGFFAFDGCTNLVSVHIDNLSAWCNIYFEDNNSNPLYYAHHLFINDEEVTELIIPNDVKAIRSYAFEGLTNLTSVTIPSSVTSIGQYAFAYCTGLTSVKVYKESPLSISSYTFTNRANATLYVPAGSKAAYEAANYWKEFKEIVEMAPVSAISFSDSNVKDICVANWDTNGDGELSEDEAATVTNLGTMFKGNSSITSFNELQYFTGLTSIGEKAFYNCSSLISVTIPENVTSIGDDAFNGCSVLASINIPSSVNSIGARAFTGCSSMSSIHITDLSAWCNISFSSDASNPLNYGHHLFLNGEEITDLVIPSGISLLKSYAFCGGYFSSVTIPSSCLFTNTKCVFAYSHIGSITINQYLASETFIQAQIGNLVIAPEVTSGGTHAFYKTTIDNLEIPYSSVTLGYSYGSNYALFDGCTINKATVNRRISSSSSDSSTMPPFYNYCTIKELHVGPNTWYNADNLCGRVTIDDLYFDGITDISANAFYSTRSGNNNIHNIHLSEEISSIGSYAFYNSCSSLNSVVAEMPSPPVIDSNTFNSRYTRSNATLYVLEGSKAAYEAAEYWQDFIIVEMASSTASVVTAPTPKELTYTGSAQELVTPGEASGGTMQYSLDGTNFSPDIPTGTDVGEYTVYYKVVGDADHSDTEPTTVSVTILPSSPAITFADANVKALCVANWDTNGDGELSEAEAAAVTTLGEVFKGNADITSFDELQYFTGLTEIGSHAFADCTSLTSVSLPSTAHKIQEWAFSNTAFTTFVIPDYIEEVATHSFYSCKQLTGIYVGTGLSTIGWKAFATCPVLSQIVVSDNNTNFDSRNESNCIIETETNTLIVGCKNTSIPSTVTNIATVAFEGCWNLTEITLPNGLVEIGELAFSWCYSLTSITIPASVTSIGSNAFENCGGLNSVTVENESPVAIDENTFSNRTNATLYVPSGSKAVYETADYWKEFKEIVGLVNIVTNSDMEGTDDVCFFSRENYPENEEIVPSTIVEGVGVDGSRGIVIQSIDNPSETWDTQFFIRLPQTLPTGTKYHMSFDYKASQEASGSTETHAEPSQYVYWNGIGTINYTADWKHFELIGTVSAEQSPADNPMRTIAFNLAVTPTSTTYYFDNVVFEIDKSQITPVAIVKEAPTPKELTYTGEAQELINPGEVLGGTMQYSLDGTNYSPDIPTGTDVGEYTVYYKVVGDADHSDTEPATVSVTIVEAMVEETNYLTAADISGIAGGSTSLVISLENEDPIYDIQFKLQLPEGVVVNKNSDNQYKVSYSDRLSGLSHEMSYREEEYYTFLIHGMENPISGNSGPIVTVGLTLSSELAGNYNIEISDIVLTKSDASKVKPRNVDVVLSLTDGQVGDVNRDGDIDVADIRCIANYILGKPNVFFDEDAADANNDGDIDVADIRTIANIILYGSNSSAKEFTDFNNDPQ